MKYPEYIRNRFKNKEDHIVASGPSLIGFDYSKLKGKKVIAVNNAYRKVDAEYCVFVDRTFIDNEAPEVVKDVVCVSRKIIDYPHIKDFKFSDRFQMDPEKGVYNRRSSGVSAITTALQGGAKKIYLYGFDCKAWTAKEAEQIARLNGDKNFKPKKEHYVHSTSDEYNQQSDELKNIHVFEQTIKLFNAFPRDMIINMSPVSAILCFKKRSK